MQIAKQYIYVLREDDSTEVRYVGRSNNLQQRFPSHFGEAEKKSKNQSLTKRLWIQEAILKDKKISMEIIDECAFEDGPSREEYWINHYRQMGHRITNTRKAKITREDFKERAHQQYLKRSQKRRVNV